jgi:hypothetical protein
MAAVRHEAMRPLCVGTRFPLAPIGLTPETVLFP